MIYIQGDKVLKILDINGEYSEYQVLGFKDPQIRIRDFRQDLLRKATEVRESDNDYGFANDFNSPAHVEIKKNGNGTTRWEIDLFSTHEQNPQYRLWIAIGVNNSIPVYDYLMLDSVFIDKDQLALISLYKHS